MYIKKSSESEDRQQLSLDGQEEALNRIVERHNLTVVGEPLRESKSARKLGRPKFDEMMKLIRKGKADAILCWHLNRLARNPVDGASIMWELGHQTIKEIRTTESTYTGTPDDGLMMSIIFGMATKKSDDLGRDVKRGYKNALTAGKWPGTAKIGYMRDRKTNEIVPDPERFDHVKEIWRLRLIGVPTMDIVRIAREDMRLTTPSRKRIGGILISQSQIYRMLHEPFFAGLMKWKGELYPGKHKPMITTSEFYSIQDIDTREHTYSGEKSRKLLYQGLFRCGSCSSMVSGERKINRHGQKYIYYHCCRKKKHYVFCPEKSVREEVIDKAFIECLESLSIPQKIEQFLIKQAIKLESSHQLEKQYDENTKNLERMRELLIKNVITETDYTTDREKYVLDNLKIEEKLRDMDDKDNQLLEPLKTSFSFLKRAKFIFKNGNYDEKRFLIKLLFSNPQIKAKTPLIKAKFPFGVLPKNGDIPDLLDHWEQIRGFAKEIKRYSTLFDKIV